MKIGASWVVMLSLSLAAGAALPGAGCSAAPVDPVARDLESTESTGEYPPVEGDGRHTKAGPVLATKNAAIRAQRLAYHRKVVAFHHYSYTLDDVAPTHRELSSLAGYVRSQAVTHVRASPWTPRAKPPAKLDRRGQGTTPIRDQGNCGSCWAFGTAATVETALGVAGQASVDIAEQQLLDCNGYGFSCGGGDFVFDMLRAPQGGVAEKGYPYEGADGPCRSAGLAAPFHVDSFVVEDSPNIGQMKAAILDHGAIGVTMSVCGSFPGFSGGVYDSPECNGGTTNHIVSLVGWDDTMPHSFGQGVWILRNSWGADWGDGGYAYVAYGVASIGEAMAYAVVPGGGGGVGGGDPGVGGGGPVPGGGGAGPGPDPNPAPPGACAHEACVQGAALDPMCSLCVGLQCLADSFCCTDAWDDACALEAKLFCSCP